MNLIDIIDDGNLITLVFNTDKIPEELKQIRGYLSIESNLVKYTKLSEQVVNNDVLATVIRVKDLTKKCDNVTQTPSDYYHDLMGCILEVGDIYSSFVELVLAHMFMTGPDEFWRYNQNKTITVKLSDKTVAAKISPLLGFTFTPNRITINEIDEDMMDVSSIDPSKLCFHEKVFLNML